jgi:serine/threonine protein kinase
MTPTRLDEEAIFNIARKITTPAVREEYLQQACGADEALRQRVQDLLRVHDQEQGFLLPPASGATVDEQPISERPGTTIGPYKLLQPIGEGGMGVVWMAEQTYPVQRKVALKIIRPGMDSAQVMARFEAERQALALMDHPNIARILDAGTTAGGRPYFVMELVKGVPLTDFCDQRRLTPKERLELFVPVCQAVQHAHTKGVIHRDLKPSNVLVALYDGKPVPKVIDFGVAKAMGQKLTERTLFTGFGVVVGTPEYMSPEQAELNQLDVDTRADVYSLGAMLYELLTGSTPLDRKKLAEGAVLEVLRHIREVEPPRPSTRLSTSEALASVAASRNTLPARLTREVRGELDWVVMKCLEKDRNRRYETASALAQDLQRYLGGEPVLAARRGAAYRLRRWLRPTLPVLVFVLVLSLGPILFLLWARFDMQKMLREHNAEHRALIADMQTRTEARQFFEENVLGAARSRERGGLGSDTTLRQALAAAERRIASTAAGRPLHEAAIRDEMGRIYLFLGEPALAERQYRSSLALRRRHRYSDDPALRTTGDEDERRFLEARSDEALLGTLEQFARALEAQGRWAEAEPLRRQALAGKAPAPPDEPAGRVAALGHLGRNLLGQGKADDAEPLLRECLAEGEKSLPDNWRVFEARSLLGGCLLRQKQYAEAEPLLLSGYSGMKDRQAKLGEEGRQRLAEAGERIVALYQAWGKPEEARQWRDRLKALPR